MIPTSFEINCDDDVVTAIISLTEGLKEHGVPVLTILGALALATETVTCLAVDEINERQEFEQAMDSKEKTH
jgi:hypothetical protein